MNKFLIDTSLYVSLFRGQIGTPTKFFDHPFNQIFLSTVVAQELYAGAQDPLAFERLNHLWKVFQKKGRLIHPTAEDWRNCGIILSQIGKRHGYESIRRARLTNDVLIALACSTIPAILLTANEKDFLITQEFLDFDFLTGFPA